MTGTLIQAVICFAQQPLGMKAGLEPYELAGFVCKSIINERVNANLIQISRWQIHSGLPLMSTEISNHASMEPASIHHSGPPEYRP